MGEALNVILFYNNITRGSLQPCPRMTFAAQQSILYNIRLSLYHINGAPDRERASQNSQDFDKPRVSRVAVLNVHEYFLLGSRPPSYRGTLSSLICKTNSLGGLLCAPPSPGFCAAVRGPRGGTEFCPTTANRSQDLVIQAARCPRPDTSHRGQGDHVTKFIAQGALVRDDRNFKGARD